MKNIFFKKIITIVLLFFVEITVFTQNVSINFEENQLSTFSYTPFKSNSVWSVSDTKYMTFGDTIINSKEYMKVFKQTQNAPFEFDINQSNYFAAIRNDSINKKVFVVFNDQFYVHNVNGEIFTCDPSDEFLLYDFSLQIGDTSIFVDYQYSTLFLFRVQRKNQIVYQNILTWNDTVIYNSDSLLILSNDNFAKKILLEAYNAEFEDFYCNPNYYIIESIGSINGIFRQISSYYGSTAGYSKLICYSNNYQTLLNTQYNTSSNCFHTIFGVKVIESTQTNSISIFPNPSEGFVYMHGLEVTNSPISIFVYDCNGSKLYNQQYIPTNEIDLSFLKNGLYFILIYEENILIYSQKILIF